MNSLRAILKKREMTSFLCLVLLFIVVGCIVHIRPCEQLVADVVTALCRLGSFIVFFLCLNKLLFQSFQCVFCFGHQCAEQFFVQGTYAPNTAGRSWEPVGFAS